MLCGAALLGSLALKVQSIRPDKRSYVQPACTVEVRFLGFPTGCRLQIDNQDLQTQVSLWNQSAVAAASGLSEGPHQLRVTLGTPFGVIEKEHEFLVDSTPPRIDLNAQPTYSSQKKIYLKGRSEAGSLARVQRKKGSELVMVDQTPILSEEAASDGNAPFQLGVDLLPGWNELQLSVEDAAGNKSSQDIRLFCDVNPPTASLVVEPKAGERPLQNLTHKKSQLSFTLKGQDDSGKITGVKVRLDEGKEKSLDMKTAADGRVRCSGVWSDMPEGTRTITYRIVDKAGLSSTGNVSFLVDSSEKLGERPLTLGAVGKDVKALQQKLVELDLFEKSAISGVFDGPTEMAIRQFQSQEGFEANGRVDSDTLASLGPRVLVNLSQCSLVLDRPGQEPRRYSVAVGAPAFPTPPGRYKIMYKEMNPTWMPPDSPWAKEAKAIPPGPGNPLGTRWIGLDSGSVGIHGTNADWSIGTAASHGCVRMHIWEVEELYELVEPGNPVVIYSGWEDCTDIKKFWSSQK